MFRPDDGPLDRKRTSLTRLARELDSDFESTRAGVVNLLQEGDFAATIDVENATPRQVFELVVDCERLYRTRICLQFVGSSEEAESESA